MKKIVLKPLEGIEIEEIGNINFGQTKSEVLALLKKTETEQDENSIYCDSLELRIDLNSGGKVEFIEFYGPHCENITPYIYGVNPFEMKAKELTKLLESKNNGKVDDTESPYGYSYLGSSVGVWRETTEKEEAECIKEAKESEEYEDWMEEDLQKAKFFWTIGIGEIDYYKF